MSEVVLYVPNLLGSDGPRPSVPLDLMVERCEDSRRFPPEGSKGLRGLTSLTTTS